MLCNQLPGSGRPVRFFITAGQVSDYTGAAALMNGLPEADWLLAPLIETAFRLPGSGQGI
ncbi:hypothetical protein OAN307_c34830 [Octadecabacter antarcticus 307]|uniref:Uncharacterized protein n=1 Tax=Octadecabacter antarcticus 307 TaxID=391626 RepID=M9RB45_9RHOB|nr:hypothetical protein OAN307_c34830 [Octadecabacter antarcticus 307]